MIDFSISLPWPFPKKENFRNIFNTYGKLGKNKGWEFECCYFHWTNLLSFNINQTFCCDHAGFEVEGQLLGFNVLFKIYDGRHWNYQENRHYERGEYRR